MSCRGIRINCAPQTPQCWQRLPASSPAASLPPGTAVVCLRYIRAAQSDQQHRIIRCSTPPDCARHRIHPDLFPQFQPRLPNIITGQDFSTHLNGEWGLKSEDYERRMGRSPGRSEAARVTIKSIRIRGLEVWLMLDFNTVSVCWISERTSWVNLVQLELFLFLFREMCRPMWCLVTLTNVLFIILVKPQLILVKKISC